MKILILPGEGYAVESKEAPVVGRHYTLEDAATGTLAQNNAFHGLLDAFWRWMDREDNFQIEADGRGYNFTSPDKKTFREHFKAKYGAGYTHIEWVDKDFGMVKEVLGKGETLDDVLERVPEYALKDFNNGNRRRIKGVLKSWTKYTKRERKEAIDQLLTIIAASGCDDKKVHEIIEGMEE